MKYYYISEDRCWADEFDTFGFILLTEEEFLELKKKTDKQLDTFFTKFSEEEFLKRQDEFQKLKQEQGAENDYQVRNIINPLPYMYGGYGNNKKFNTQYDAPYEQYLSRWSGYSNSPELEIGFGTNESHIFYSKEDFWRDIDIKEISEQEYNTLLKIIGKEQGIMCFPYE